MIQSITGPNWMRYLHSLTRASVVHSLKSGKAKLATCY